MKTTHKTLTTLAAVALITGFSAQYVTAGCGVCGGGAGHSHEGEDTHVTKSTEACGEKACPTTKATKACGEKACPASKDATSEECCTPDKSCKEGACAATAGERAKVTEKQECTEKTCTPGKKQQKQHKEKAYHEVTPQQLNTLLESGQEVVVLDARSGKYDDGRRIPGATQLDADATAEEIAQVVPDKNATVVTYCSNLKCPASKYLAKSLAKHGYQNVHKLPEGIDGWEAAGFTVEQN